MSRSLGSRLRFHEAVAGLRTPSEGLLDPVPTPGSPPVVASPLAPISPRRRHALERGDDGSATYSAETPFPYIRVGSRTCRGAGPPASTQFPTPFFYSGDTNTTQVRPSPPSPPPQPSLCRIAPVSPGY